MSNDEAAIAIVALELVTAMATIKGLLASARVQVEEGLDPARLDCLLLVAELEAVHVADELQDFVRGLSDQRADVDLVGLRQSVMRSS